MSLLENQNALELATSKADLKALLSLYDKAPCGTVTFNKEGVILNTNTTFVNWLGYTKEEVIGSRTLSSFLKIGGQIYFETHFFPLIQLQGYIKEIYFDFKRKDASVLRGLINVRELSIGSDAVVYQAIVLDVSERWSYEEELRVAKQKAEDDSKIKAKLLATISHEIRTPLNAILGIGHLLHQTPLNKNQEDYARLLLHSSEHLLSLVNNLLDLSKIEANKFELSKAPFSLQDVLDILDQTFGIKAQEKHIQFAIEIAEDVPTNIVGDVIKLKQILINLIGNALNFTKEGGVSLTVSLLDETKDKVRLRFEIIDTGIGIPAEKLETIFGEFSQASQEINAEFGGTGLGLTISKKLVELHDSTLIVTSEEGLGSSFQFDFVYGVAQETELSSYRTIQDDTLYNFEGYQVLVVDDNPSNLFIAGQFLDNFGVSYETASSGSEAVEKVKTLNPHLILLDLHMPLKDGYETAKEIRLIPSDQHLKIVAFSASTMGSIEKRLQDAGIDDFLPKPFQPHQLLDILKMYLGNSSNETPNDRKQARANDLPIVTATKTTDPQSRFSLDRYKMMAKNKPEYLKKFVLSTLNGLLEYDQDFKSAIHSKNAEALSELIHKSTMSLHYIDAGRLSHLLKQCREQLCAGDSKVLQHTIDLCNDEFTFLISELERLSA